MFFVWLIYTITLLDIPMDQPMYSVYVLVDVSQQIEVIMTYLSLYVFVYVLSGHSYALIRDTGFIIF